MKSIHSLLFFHFYVHPPFISDCKRRCKQWIEKTSPHSQIKTKQNADENGNIVLYLFFFRCCYCCCSKLEFKRVNKCWIVEAKAIPARKSIGYHAITDVKSITITIQAIQNNRCGCEKSQRYPPKWSDTPIFTPHIWKYGIRKWPIRYKLLT